MAVLIEGMEMPKEGSWVTLRVFPDGQCFLYSWCGNDFDFMEHLTAAHVPEPHGRLINADALDVVLKNEAESLDVNVYACGIADGLSLARSCIETASTVIPASMEG